MPDRAGNEGYAKVREDCTITEKAPTRAFSWLKAATTAFTFKTLLRHYAKRTLTPRFLNVKLGPRCNYHKGRAAIRDQLIWQIEEFLYRHLIPGMIYHIRADAFRFFGL